MMSIFTLLTVIWLLRPLESGLMEPGTIQQLLVRELPEATLSTFRADPYIAAAATLQARGEVKAKNSLLSTSIEIEVAFEGGKKERAEARQDSHKLILLCRMLFIAKPKKEFRRPLLGGPNFLGRTTLDNWPLEPIEIIEGVPFFIVDGYDIGGSPEASRSYVEYCIRNCEWNTFQYKSKDAEQKKKSLELLINSKKWQAPLTQEEKTSLSAQIK